MVFLRKAERKDIDLLYKWANDPVVRKNSFNSKTISYESHIKWFDRIICDPTILLYILMVDDTPVGQIRLDVEDGEAEISYSIDSEFRGKGYGRIILQLIAREVNMNHQNIITLVAKVKPDNIISKNLFESEGYKMIYACYTLKNGKRGTPRTR